MNGNTNVQVNGISAETDAWIRRDWAISIAFLASFLLPTTLYFVSSAPTTQDGITVSAIVTCIVVGHLLMIRWWSRETFTDIAQMPRQRHAIIATYGLLNIALWFVLISYSMTFMFGLSGLFPTINSKVPFRSAIPLNLLLLLLMVLAFFGGRWNHLPQLSPYFLLMFFATAVPTMTIYGWIWSVIQQSGERRDLIQQLAQVRRELLAAERHTGVLEERQRLAREIHDTLAQGFTSIVMNLEAAEQADDMLNSTTQTHLERARTTARESLEQSRRVIADLRPQPLEDGSFTDAIHRTVANWSAKGNVPAHSSVTGSPLPLSAEAELALLRAVQESLNNVRKHASAQSVNVTLSYMDDVVMLDVQDDGVGMAAPAREDSFGLQAMRERIAMLKGTLEIESAQNQGTTVVVTVPV